MKRRVKWEPLTVTDDTYERIRRMNPIDRLGYGVTFAIAGRTDVCDYCTLMNHADAVRQTVDQRIRHAREGKALADEVLKAVDQ